MHFINQLKTATLDESGLSADVIHHLHYPIEAPLDIDPDLRLALDIFINVSNASKDMYTATKIALNRHDGGVSIPTYKQIQSQIAKITSIVPLIYDMCHRSCVAYMGSFSNLTHCPECGNPQFDPLQPDKMKPHRRFSTIPLGPQLQALWHSPESTAAMGYHVNETQKILDELAQNGHISTYEDFFHGWEYLEAIHQGDIQPGDITLMLSINNTQLYQNKQSNCWMYVWLMPNLSPNMRYTKKQICPGGFIPGPHPPKHVESFLFPGLHHLTALQIEGLRIWDASQCQVFTSNPYFLIGATDSPGLIHLNGLVGHQGAYSCQFYCPLKGCWFAAARHYYPAHLKPDNYHAQGCNHADVDIKHLQQASPAEYLANLTFLLASATDSQYTNCCRDTGISHPSIFSGLHVARIFGLPCCFCADLMHLTSLNITNLLLSLWCEVIECYRTDNKSEWDWAVLVGNIWNKHGKTIANCTPYLPGSFDRPPHNPAKKINSGYKAWEFLTYIYSLSPGLFYGVLPDKYWHNFCKLVKAI
jgi:Transposase family tnp2